jgi:hypothetical protein
LLNVVLLLLASLLPCYGGLRRRQYQGLVLLLELGRELCPPHCGQIKQHAHIVIARSVVAGWLLLLLLLLLRLRLRLRLGLQQAGQLLGSKQCLSATSQGQPKHGRHTHCECVRVLHQPGNASQHSTQHTTPQHSTRLASANVGCSTSTSTSPSSSLASSSLLPPG